MHIVYAIAVLRIQHMTYVWSFPNDFAGLIFTYIDVQVFACSAHS